MNHLLVDKNGKRLPTFTPWYGFDLDGTLAHYESGQLYRIGEPIEPMVELAKKYHEEGKEVRIVTARVATLDQETLMQQLELIQTWALRHLGFVPIITASKDFALVLLYDDRAVAVEHNTGKILGGGDGDHA